MGAGSSKEIPPTVRCALFGLPGSGKTTFVRAARLSSTKVTPSEQLYNCRQQIFVHTVNSMRQILYGAVRLELRLVDNRVRTFANAILQVNKQDQFVSNARLVREYANALEVLWYERSVQESYQKRHKYNLSETHAYFFNRTEAIIKSDYEPSREDILHIESKSLGIEERCVKWKGKEIVMIDVPGNHRDLSAFKTSEGYDIDVFLFFIDISAYDQAKIGQKNYFDKALDYFNSVRALRCLRDAHPIVVFSKGDRFVERLRVSPLGVWMPGCSNYCFQKNLPHGQLSAFSVQEEQFYLQYRQAYLEISNRVLKHCKHTKTIKSKFIHLLGPRVTYQSAWVTDNFLEDSKAMLSYLWNFD